MLYCPNCGSEYREGYSSCSDCQVLLVRERPLGSGKESFSASQDSRAIWRGVDQQYCVSVCHSLQDLGISYRVVDTPVSLMQHLGVTRRYEIFVSYTDYKRAKSGLNIEEDIPETLSESEWQELEEPEDPDATEEGPYVFRETLGTESLPDTPARRDAYFRDWYSEDATVQVWSGGGDEDFSGGIEMALKENLIHCRVDGDGDNRKVVFVLPEDESRAREIVREIIEGTPME